MQKNVHRGAFPAIGFEFISVCCWLEKRRQDLVFIYLVTGYLFLWLSHPNSMFISPKALN